MSEPPGTLRTALLAVFRKELADAVRDRRSWIVALVVAMLSGPVVFTLIGRFVGALEERAAAREIFVAQPERSPTLVNFLQRAGASVKTAPPDYEAQLRAGRLLNAVVVPPPAFETELARGATVTVDLVYDDSHERAQPQLRAAAALLAGFNRELGTQRLIARGVAPSLLAPLQIEERSLAPAQARGAQLLFIVPWAALIVAVFGAISVAIDVTAGERERGSLEPLLMNPVPVAAIVVGKWAVVVLYSVAIVTLTLLGFLLSMRLLSGETLSALMQLDWLEVALFCAVLLPFAALMAAVNMLAATFGRSHKEAQTHVSYIAMAVQFAAVLPMFLAARDAAWQLWVPSVGQLTVLMKVVRSEPIGPEHLAVPLIVCVLGTAASLALLARLLRREAIVFAKS